jgi:hypothetical protein
MGVAERRSCQKVVGSGVGFLPVHARIAFTVYLELAYDPTQVGSH